MCSCVNEAKADWVTLIIKLVDFCNFECSFCRYSTNKQRHILSFDTYKNCYNVIYLDLTWFISTAEDTEDIVKYMQREVIKELRSTSGTSWKKIRRANS